MVPGLSDIANQQKQFDALIRQLPFIITSAAGISNSTSGKGMFWEGREIKYLLANAGIRHEMYLADKKVKMYPEKD
jgi:hypothetical protein